MPSDEIRIEDDGDTVRISTGDPLWVVKERGDEWQVVVGMSGGSGSHGTYESRDEAVRYVLGTIGLLDE